MGAFDKKKAFSIGGVVAVIVGATAFLANVSEIIQLFKKDDKPSESSVAVVTNAEESFQNSAIEQLDAAEADYVETSSQPSVIYLDSLKTTESFRFYENISNAEDTIGNKYAGHVCTIGDRNAVDNSAYAVYYLGGKYKTLSGTIAVDDVTYEESEAEISVSCDESIVYSTEKMGRISVPVEFSVDVENCQWLKISNLQYDSTGKFILADWKLE